MMEKIIILSAGKTPRRSTYTFEKSLEVVDAIDNILEKLGFRDAHSHGLRDAIYRADFAPDIEISEFVDEAYALANENYFIDAFLGAKKIILNIRTSGDKQQKISEAVFEFADFEEGST